MKSFKLSVVIEKDKDGYYAYCPELQGAIVRAIRTRMHLKISGCNKAAHS